MARVKQEMPPPGGYRPIDWAYKGPGRRLWSGKTAFGIFGAITTSAWIWYAFSKRRRVANQLEMNDARIALEPFMLAERHRLYLTQLRKNREEEREIMKDVEGWEVGKYNGEPVYWNVADRFHVVGPEEYYMHNDFKKDFYGRLYEKHNH